MAWGVRNLIFTQVGELYDCFTARGATVVGFTDQDGYDHYDSKAIRDDKFCGLMCDEQNQMDQSEDRATAWVEQLKAEGHAALGSKDLTRLGASRRWRLCPSYAVAAKSRKIYNPESVRRNQRHPGGDTRPPRCPLHLHRQSLPTAGA